MMNRSRYELSNTFGLFTSWIPFPFHVEPLETFGDLIERVAQMCRSMTTHLSLVDRNVVEQYEKSSHTLPNIPTSLNFESITNTIDLGDECELARYSRSRNVVQHDLSLVVKVDECQQMTGSFDYACDVFDESTIATMADRFECLFDQIFSSSIQTPFCELSLLFSHEVELQRQLNEGDSLALQTALRSIHQLFVHHANEHPQKLSLILDEQSLTYAELLHSAQLVAQHLIDHCHVEIGDIVAQYAERSFEMSIGMMEILLSGGSYLPLAPDALIERLHAVIELTHPRCLSVNSGTDRLYSSSSIDHQVFVECVGNDG